METLDEKIARVVKDEVAVVAYDPQWPGIFQKERRHLLRCLPAHLIRRIEHFGSTAVPGLSAKPIVDMLVEVSDLEQTHLQMAPILEAQGYEYFERPTHDDDKPPVYAWFIKRDEQGRRTHHIHMVDGSSEHAHHWNRLLFRDYLIAHPDTAREYGNLKTRLAALHHGDRIRYSIAKADFVADVTALAMQHEDSSRTNP
jgi:GrpB-like predicted nucleotidyltransferase (UPF0157 family)